MPSKTAAASASQSAPSGMSFSSSRVTSRLTPRCTAPYASQRVRSAADAPVGRPIFDCLSSSATWIADAAFLKSASVSLPAVSRACRLMTLAESDASIATSMRRFSPAAFSAEVSGALPAAAISSRVSVCCLMSMSGTMSGALSAGLSGGLSSSASRRACRRALCSPSSPP